MNVKNKKVKNYSKESNSKHLSQMKVENTESERAPVVFCKRGAKRKQIIDQDSDQFSQAKQSLLEAKEPDPDVLSKNSYLFSHELSSDGNTSALKPKDFGISEIVNVHTKSGGKFSKTASLKKSTFLGEEEEADLMNVNEFDTYEDYYDNRLVKIGKLAGHGRVLKTLPITKESFLNWQKQSILKSFATSQEASFVSNRPTERIEPDKIMNEVINPSRLLESEKKRFKNDIIQNNSRKPTNYKQLAAEGSSPGQFSTPYLDESSIFEECHHDSGYREPSHSSMRRVEEIKEQRKGKLHN